MYIFAHNFAAHLLLGAGGEGRRREASCKWGTVDGKRRAASGERHTASGEQQAVAAASSWQLAAGSGPELLVQALAELIAQLGAVGLAAGVPLGHLGCDAQAQLFEHEHGQR